jgi:hypothetical protein
MEVFSFERMIYSLVSIIPHTFECVKEKIELKDAGRIARLAGNPSSIFQFQCSEE